MRNSSHWSKSSAPCRLEWRPSRLLVAAQWMLGVLAAASIVASEMPRAWAWPAALVALAWGGWTARRESRRAPQAWVWPGQGAVTVDDLAVEEVALHWRGPLAFVRWRDHAGRVRRSSWWPDTLDAGSRRELRLAALARSAARASRSMAP
jgi:toxin CptA